MHRVQRGSPWLLVFHFPIEGLDFIEVGEKECVFSGLLTLGTTFTVSTVANYDRNTMGDEFHASFVCLLGEPQP